jgi:hypothetical protein
MKLFNNSKLTSTVLTALACVAFVGCSDSATRDTSSRMDSTVSNTTIAADDTPKTLDTTGSVPPAAADTSAASESATSTRESTATTTDSKAAAKRNAKKAHRRNHSARHAHAKRSHEVALNRDDARVYDNNTYNNDVVTTDNNTNTMDVSHQDDIQTTSGVTTAPDTYRETGLSPFAQEPNSRMPIQIGSGQLTGEDKSTTVLEGPSLFQDPSALGRELIH